MGFVQIAVHFLIHSIPYIPVSVFFFFWGGGEGVRYRDFLRIRTLGKESGRLVMRASIDVLRYTFFWPFLFSFG